MREQILAILWAQVRITRNHFPRSSFGTVLSWSVTGIWHLMFAVFAVLIARALQAAPAEYLVLGLSAGLLAVFAYMLLVPLVTASAGWSLQLDQLQAFPIANRTLFSIEVVLRLTSSPEMLILLCGGFAGLLLRQDVFPLAPLFLLLFLSFTLFLQLALRDFILHSFSRSRFREIAAILLASTVVLPRLLVSEDTLPQVKSYLLLIANGTATPWHQMALQSSGRFSFRGIAAILCWNVLAAVVARRQFRKSLNREDSFRTPAIISVASTRALDPISRLTRPLPDPFGALFEKELRSLIRMPRFRVIFGMACVFSIFVFMPLALNMGRNSFMSQNMLPVTSLYGLLLLSDVLLINIFGFDRGAAQVYFATPPAISIAIRAKNLAAVVFIALQSLAVPLLALLFRVPFSSLSLEAGLLSSAVVAVFLLAAGNLISVYLPRPINPRNPFRQQAGGKVQLWLLVCTLGMFLLVGAAFFARWATDRDWVLLAILGFELAVGLMVYWISLESTVQQAVHSRERIVSALSQNASPMGS
jgi:ABC-2 type transport system permease protein